MLLLCQDLPVKLFIDNSSTMEIEEGGDGIWNIVGGKVRELSVTLFLAAVLICFFFYHFSFYFFLANHSHLVVEIFHWMLCC